MFPVLPQDCIQAKAFEAGEHPTAAANHPPLSIRYIHLELQITSPGDQHLCPMFGAKPGKASNTLSTLGVSDGLGNASRPRVPKLESACETSSCEDPVLPPAPLKTAEGLAWFKL